MDFRDDQEKKYMPEEPGFLIVRVMTNAALMAYLVAAGRLFFEPASFSVLVSSLAMAASALVFAWVQRNVKGIFAYGLIHAAVVAVLAVTGAGMFDLIFRMVVIVYATGMAFHARIRKAYLVYPGPPLLAIPGFVFVPAYTLGNRPVQTISILMVTYLMLSWLFYRNLTTFAGTIREARAFTKVPFNRMRRVNAGILAVFLTASAALAALTALIVDGEAVIAMVRDGIATFMRLVLYGIFWVLSLLLRGGGEEAAEAAEEQAQQAMPLAGEAASNPILEMLYRIFEVVLFIAVTVALCYLAYRLIVDFYHDFRAADMENKDKRRYILPEERERTRLAREERLSPFDFSPEARIRRIYIRLMKRHPEAEKIRPHLTPAEIEEAVLGYRSDAAGNSRIPSAAVASQAAWTDRSASSDTPQAADSGSGNKAALPADAMTRVHVCYELARYAPERVTQEDLRIMREAAREIR